MRLDCLVMVVGAGQWRRGLVPVGLAALVAHLTVLYWPVVTVAGPVVWSDKVVHVLVFALPTFLLGAAVTRPAWMAAAFAVHAPVSELLQHTVLPGRSGDPWDAFADLVGVAVGVVLLVVRAQATR